MTKITSVRAKFQFMAKISIFVQNFNFWRKFQLLTKISIFNQNFFFDQNFNLWENFNFWPKFQYVRKFQFLTQISPRIDIVVKHWYVCQKSKFSLKFENLDKKRIFWAGLLFFVLIFLTGPYFLRDYLRTIKVFVIPIWAELKTRELPNQLKVDSVVIIGCKHCSLTVRF